MIKKSSTSIVKIKPALVSTPEPSMPASQEKKSSDSGSGIKNNLIAAASYFPFFPVPIILPLLIYFTVGKDDKFVKFHSAQSLVLELILFGLGIVFGVIFFVFWLLGIFTIFLGGIGGLLMLLAFLILFVYIGFALLIALYRFYLMYKAYKEEKTAVPFVSGLVEKFLM